MIRLILTLAFLLLASPSWAAVALGSCTKEEGIDPCSTCDTTAHTVLAGENYLVVFVGSDADQDPATAITSVTWDFGGSAQALSPVSTNAGTGIVMGAAYTVLNPAVGNKTLRVVTSFSTQCCDIKICSFSGVNPVTPIGTIVETESTASVAGDSLAFTLTSGGLAVAYLVTQGPHAAFAQGADQTQRQRTVATTCATGDCDSTVTTATISPMNYTWTSTGQDFWHVVLPLNPSTARPIPPIFTD